VIPVLWRHFALEAAMMGRQTDDQGHLFYDFCLAEAVPDDHPVRKIAAVLDLSWVYGELAPYYPTLGRPSIDPALMMRMLIIGYVFGLRSERLLCREVQVNFAYRWFCKLGIEHKIPNHSVFSRARNERFRDCCIFRRVFERVVEACIAAGLVGGEGFAVDASALIPFPTALLSTALQHGGLTDAAVAIKLYAAIGCLMCLSWLFLFHVLSINPHLLEAHVERSFFPRERHRALFGVALYMLGGITGWALSPMLALICFLGLTIFYGITSEGLVKTRVNLLGRLSAGRSQHKAARRKHTANAPSDAHV
jgi:transposase